MNKPFYIFLFVLLSAFGKAQTNLVYNGDFELYDTCPTNISTPGDLQIERCLGWTAPTKLGTSDYFNICNNPIASQPAGVPQNYFGYQYPYNGNGYTGFYPWAINSNDSSNYREYLQTVLIHPLVAGKKYHFSFHVSYYGVNFSVEKIGALFSIQNYNTASYSPIVANPQIVNKNGALTDSLGWTKIEGEFMAYGGELFLTIGYFEDSLIVNDTLNTHSEPLVFYESYYFVDGLELIEIDQSIPNSFTPNNDGYNDLFKIQGIAENDQVSVFNRWGVKVANFIGNDGWDGRTISGELCNNGVYYFVIENKEKQNSQKGFIQLIR